MYVINVASIALPPSCLFAYLHDLQWKLELVVSLCAETESERNGVIESLFVQHFITDQSTWASVA